MLSQPREAARVSDATQPSHTLIGASRLSRKIDVKFDAWTAQNDSPQLRQWCRRLKSGINFEPQSLQWSSIAKTGCASAIPGSIGSDASAPPPSPAVPTFFRTGPPMSVE